MPALNILLDPTSPSLDALQAKRGTDQVIEVAEDATINLIAVPEAMRSGRTAVTITMELPDGRTVLGSTSLRLLWTGVNAIAARYGEPHMQRPDVTTT